MTSLVPAQNISRSSLGHAMMRRYEGFDIGGTVMRRVPLRYKDEARERSKPGGMSMTVSNGPSLISCTSTVLAVATPELGRSPVIRSLLPWAVRSMPADRMLLSSRQTISSPDGAMKMSALGTQCGRGWGKKLMRWPTGLRFVHLDDNLVQE